MGETIRKFLPIFAVFTFLSLVFLPPTVLAEDPEEIIIESDTTWKFSRIISGGWPQLGYDDSSWGFTIAPSAGRCPVSAIRGLNFADPMWAPNAVAFETVFFRKNFTLESDPSAASIKYDFDDDGDMYINGTLIRHDITGRVEAIPYVDDITELLHAGPNVIAMKVRDVQGGCQWAMVAAELTISFDTVLDVPLFKQNDPQWGGQTYASANRRRLDCGSTIAQCGCALTSATMVLNYHGATRDPLTGESTTPETLNSYLKQSEKCKVNGCISKGYSFGSILWPVVGNYSADANRRFGTQKIEYMGLSNYNEEVTKNDILVNNPVILKVLNSSHWATVIGVLADTFALHDPAHNRTKLSDAPYNNTAFKMTRYQKTSSDFSFFEVTSLAPTQILLTDSEGRRTGFDEDTNSMLEEIPSSYYYFEEAIDDDTGENPPPPAGSGIYVAGIKYPQQDSYDVQVVGDAGDLYSFAVHGSDRDGGLLFDLFEATPSGNVDHSYTFNYSPEPGAQTLGMRVPIDIKPGNETNPINCTNEKGVIPVALLSTETFNATTVDHTTVQFEGATETHVNKKTGEPQRHEEDVNGDGRVDLVFHFRLGDTDLDCNSIEGRLVGEDQNGLMIEGTDVVN